MALMRALAARLVLNRRKLQEELDIWRLYHLLYYFERCGGKEVQLPRPKEVSFTKQYHAVHTAVTRQAVRKLTVLQEAISRHTFSKDSGEIELPRMPFQLSVRDAPSSTNPFPGVRLEGHAVPGTVVCFYPGTVYLPPHVKHMPNYPNITQHNPYLMSRTDGSIISAKEYTSEEIQMHQFAVGHLVRHPAEGEHPNVMPFSYEVAPAFPTNLLPLIPNRYHKKPGFLYSTKSPMRTLVFVAMKHLRDEELLLNYRLHPDSKLPEWYVSVDSTEDRRRWRY